MERPCSIVLSTNSVTMASSSASISPPLNAGLEYWSIRNSSGTVPRERTMSNTFPILSVKSLFSSTRLSELKALPIMARSISSAASGDSKMDSNF